MTERNVNNYAARPSEQKVDLRDDLIKKPAPKTAAQLAAEKRARQIAHWHKILAPQLPDIDPHDLDLIIDSLLKTPKERMQLMFLNCRAGKASSLSARAQKKIRISDRMAWIASLEDIIAAKKAANRPKDKAKLKIRQETLETKNRFINNK